MMNSGMLFLRFFFCLGMASSVCVSSAMPVVQKSEGATGSSMVMPSEDQPYCWPTIKNIKLADLVSIGKDLEIHWLEIGMLLGVSNKNLQLIACKKQTIQAQYREMWRSWQETCVDKKFSRLALALYLPCGGNTLKFTAKMMNKYDSTLDSMPAIRRILINEVQKFEQERPKNQAEWKKLIDNGGLELFVLQNCSILYER